MTSTATNSTLSKSRPRVSLEAGTRSGSQFHQPLAQLEASILEINNDGVGCLLAGNNKAAMIRLARCLAIMRSSAIDGDAEVHYRFARPVRNTVPGVSDSSPTYVFTAPLIVDALHHHDCHECAEHHGEEALVCKLLSLVLFNLSLAHHLYALELLNSTQYKNQEAQRRQNVRDLLEKSLRLYELCHSSLVFTNSGLLCSDLSVAVVVTNNVGEVHKQLQQQTELNHHEHHNTSIACSEQLIQIFMFFAANGQPKRLEGFEEILSNSMATLNGPQKFAPAA